MGLNTPVLLLAFRRPHTTQQVINAIRAVKPTRMFVACDGPNPDRPGEAAKVRSTRELIEREIDWPCSLELKYSDTYQGCRASISSAITWFFDQVYEGIILEDDCIPHIDFFRYCSDLLECYRNDTRVFSICGSNFQQSHVRGDASYYFSIHADSWGWATWRRSWQLYAKAEKDWTYFRDSCAISNVLLIPAERKYWVNNINNMFTEHSIDSWFYQWLLAGWMNNALSIWPNTNLISNIGFQMVDATHTNGESKFANLPTSSLGLISHPRFVAADREADSYAFYHRRHGKLFILRNKLGVFYYIFRFFDLLLEEGPRGYLKRIMSAANYHRFFSIMRATIVFGIASAFSVIPL